MLILIKSFQNTLKHLKISNTIFLDFQNFGEKFLIDKIILPQLAPPIKPGYSPASTVKIFTLQI